MSEHDRFKTNAHITSHGCANKASSFFGGSFLLAGACTGDAGLVQRSYPDAMTSSTSRSLVFSVLLHGFIIAVAVLLMMPASREQVIVPQAFTIFSVPAQSQSHASSNPATPGPAVKFPAVPVPVPPRRVPSSVVRTAPERTSPRTTAEEFRQRHPSTARPSGPRTVSRPSRIDIGSVLAQTGEDSSSAPPTAADENLSADYLARLMGKLRTAHQKPDGLDAGLKALVEFSIRADGSLADVRIIESSGSREFDESVVAAFLKVRDLCAPPHGASRGNRVTFRTSDGA
ncbi:MAG: energy transducer TonB [Opitutaceae bacterium]